MDNENQGQATPPAIEPKKKKLGCFWKIAIGFVGAIVILGIIGSCGDGEEDGGGSGKGGWQYTGKELSDVFSGFPEDEGMVYVNEEIPYGYKIKILQATKNGNLVEFANYTRMIWVETPGKRYEDGQPLGVGYYVRRGSYEYTTALGAEKTVARYVLVTGKELQKLEGRWEATAKTTGKVLGIGSSAGETKLLTLPGGATMEMVWCPAGSFTMGSPEDEANRDDDETQHQVTLTKGFWMAKTEVTQAQWQSVMGNNPAHHKGDDLPVEDVSWYECQAFCKNAGLELPTEAEWEYACRAGSTGKYGGTGNLEDMGWYDDNSEDETHPVGQKQPNAWGLYDMHGNVKEWCADWYGDYPSGSVTNPTGAGSDGRRVLRGESCWDIASDCRSASRDGNYPGFRLRDDGFRPVARQD